MLGSQSYIFRAYQLLDILKVQGNDLPDAILKDMILWQCATDKVIETVINEKESCLLVSKAKPKCVRKMTPIEENTVRYAGGFVIRKVIAKYKKKKAYGDHLDCLKSLILNDQDDDTEKASFLQYTRVWLEKTDRGGLYHITDSCFELFYEIEQTVYDKLNANFKSKEKVALEDIEQAAYNDSDVSRLWHVCTSSLDVTVKASDELLLSIIHEWTTLRGHSLTSKYMEDYKKSKQDKLKKKEGIRGELKLMYK